MYLLYMFNTCGPQKDDKVSKSMQNTVFYQGNARIVYFNDMSRTE
jgi:hypothetical protein